MLNDLERGSIIELGRGWIRIKRLKDLQTYAGLVLATLHAFFVLVSAG